MDPFLEGSGIWPDFHSRLAVSLADQLLPKLLPRYVVDVEKRVYVESQSDSPYFVPDVTVSHAPFGDWSSEGQPAEASTGTATYAVPLAGEQRQSFLVIRDRESRTVVTVIEILSPGNKIDGGDGRKEYLVKRNEVLETLSNLVEIDLLRGGLRAPTIHPLRKQTDYCVLICRGSERPRAEAFEWSLRDELPTIPIPLRPGDAESSLNLQVAFEDVYGRARYDLRLDYSRELSPSPRPADVDWIRSRLAKPRTM